MTIASIGFDHTTTPFEVLEGVALAPQAISEALDHLVESEHITEAVIISTCMRTEIVIDTLRFHAGIGHALDVLAKVSGTEQLTLRSHVVERFDHQVAQHLFRLAAGLESAVLGEHEILGQVARCWQTAREAKTSRSSLNELFRHAVAAGKRARHETAIARGTTSIGQAAVAMAEASLGSLSHRNVLVLGAGEMGEAMGVAASYAKQSGEVVVVNRTQERAVTLAERIHARAADYAHLGEELVGADVLLTSTGSEQAILDLDDVTDLMERRSGKPLVIVDMGLPRDVDPRVVDVRDVTLLDLDNLKLFTEASRNDRLAEVESVEAIVDDEVSEYLKDVNIRSIAPLIQGLYERAEAVRVAELNRQRNKMQQFSEEQLAIVDGLTSSLIAKILHTPVSRMKSSAGTPEGEYLTEAMRLLLDK